MSDNNDNSSAEASTRRDAIKYGGAVITGGVLAGCAGGDGDSESTPTSTDAKTPTATETAVEDESTQTETSAGDDATATETATPKDQSYTVTMEPMGAVEFDSVPERWMTWSTDYADIGLVLGQMDGLSGMLRIGHWSTGNGGGALGFVNSLSGVEFDPSNLPTLVQGNEFDVEVFYEVDAEVHIMDPRIAAQSAGGEDRIAEVRERVGPFVGSRLRFQLGDIFEADSRLYSLYEATEKMAEVFQERERYEAIKQLHDEFIADIQSRLPQENERPDVAVVSSGSNPGEIGIAPSKLYGERIGTETKQYRDLGVTDLFEEAYPDNQSYAIVDAEALLEVDPDVIIGQDGILRYGTQEQFRANMVAAFEEDEVVSEVTAVKNNEIYIGGTYYQGPIINLFQTEMLAKQLYPGEFGEYRGPFEVPEDEQLFDRQKISDIINGNI